METDRLLTIQKPGLMTTVQDLGRRGMAQYGVSPGGALDRRALVLGNRLLGNAPGAAALECTLTGPEIVFERDAIIALTGSDFGPMLDGASIPMWEPVSVSAGSRLSFAPAPRDGGVRLSICVAGGIAVKPILDSRSTDLIGLFGGFEGRTLRAGDRLPIGEPCLDRDSILKRRLAYAPSSYVKAITARVSLGPQKDRFTSAGLATFLSESYAVTSKADRTGMRLSGPAIEQTNGADLISEGIAHGAIQVPGDGQPIVLLAARQTVGGYTKIATVIGADLDLLGQQRSGGEIHFEAMSIERARVLTRDYLYSIGEDAIVTQPRKHLVQGAIEMPDSAGSRGEWSPDGLIRVIEAAERSGVIHLRLEIPDAGISLELDRGATAPVSESPFRQDATNDDVVITAPVLGTLYRRRTPDDPLLVSEGEHVDAGSLIALIEVMKNYHEVTAPVAGTITRILVQDGHYVEYGEALVHLSPDR
jgi:antagonist of KipI